MKKKTVQRHTFEFDGNAAVRVTYPDGRKESMSTTQGVLLYKQLYAQKNAPIVFNKTMLSLGIPIAKYHLLTENVEIVGQLGVPYKVYLAGIRQTVTYPKYVVHDALEKAFREADIDLSFNSVKDVRYGIIISGNAGAIASEYIRYMMSYWWDIEMSIEDLSEYLRKHPKIGIYQESSNGLRKLDRKTLLQTQFGTTYSNRGIGSQSSIVESYVKLKTDKAGNLMVACKSLIYD